MNAAEFRKLINKHFSPHIRQHGWKGSGFNFYKHEPNHVVNIFGLHGAWYGGSVCCETAIHFDFIPDLTGREIDVSKMSFASCVIRKRLTPGGDGDYHWRFQSSEEDNLKSVHQIWEAFRTHGIDFYNDFANFPHPFDTIRPDDLTPGYLLLDKYYTGNPIHFAWLLKGINLFIGRRDIAKDFSMTGLRLAMENAESMAGHSKGKSAQASIEQYIDFNKKWFTDGV
jgi:hypothetical protein